MHNPVETVIQTHLHLRKQKSIHRQLKLPPRGEARWGCELPSLVGKARRQNFKFHLRSFVFRLSTCDVLRQVPYLCLTPFPALASAREPLAPQNLALPGREVNAPYLHIETRETHPEPLVSLHVRQRASLWRVSHAQGLSSSVTPMITCSFPYVESDMPIHNIGTPGIPNSK